MKYTFIHYKFIGIIFLSLILSSVFSQNPQYLKELKQAKKTCGMLCLENVYETINAEKLSPQINYSPINFTGLISVAKKLGLESYAVELSIQNLKSLKQPVVLQLNDEHFVVAKAYRDGKFHIYDPNLGDVFSDITKLANQWNGKAIVFETIDDCEKLDATTNKTVFGYHNEIPPAVPAPGDPDGEPNSCGPGVCCVGGGDASGVGGGDGSSAPRLSISHISMAIYAEDVPIWYDAGKGPDCSCKLIYSTRANQSYSGPGNTTTQYYPFGDNWFFNYGSFYVQQGNNVLIIDGDGSRDLFTFSNGEFISPYGKLATLQSADNGYTLKYNSGTTYYYTSAGHSKLTAIEDKNGDQLKLFYDSNFNLDYLTDANNRHIEVDTDDNGRITSIKDPIERTAEFVYENGFLVDIKDMGDFHSIMTYETVPIWIGSSTSSDKLLTSLEIPDGTTQLTYQIPNSFNWNVEIYRITSTNPNGDSKTVTWRAADASTGYTKVTEYDGNVYDHKVDISNTRITKITYPDIDASRSFSYNTNGSRDEVTEGIYTTFYEYTNEGKITKETDPLDRVTSYTYYDDNKYLKTITDPMNRVTTYTYDESDNTTSITTISGTQLFSYTNGQLESSTDANGNVTEYNYFPEGYTQEIIYPDGSKTEYTYDAIGRLQTQTANGITVSMEYDKLNQLTSVTFPDETSVSNVYDFRKLIETTDRAGRKTTYTYENGCSSCGGSNIAEVNGPEGTISYERDAAGNVLSLDINGQVTSYEYDNMQRVIRETNPDGTYKQYTWDELGNLLTRKDENGTLTTYSYNYDLLMEIDYSDNTPDVSYTYNDNSEVLSMTDGTGTTYYTYNDAGRLIGVNGPEADDDLSYTYDPAGNRLSMSIPGMEVNYAYDNMNRIYDLVGTHASASYEYGSNGLMSKMTYGNGTYTDYTYDNLNRLKTLNNKKSSGEVFSGFTYSYNKASMIDKIVDNEGNVSEYGYDYAQQLIEEDVKTRFGKTMWHNKFAYDNMGNRLTLDKNGITDTYKYNINNQLTELNKTVINVEGFVYGDSLAEVFVDGIMANTTYLGDSTLQFKAENIPIDNGEDSVLVYAKVNQIISAIDDSSRFMATTSKNPDGSININLFTEIDGIDPAYINTIHIDRSTINYTYDKNGNMTHRYSPTDTITYSWDAENRLVRVDLPDGVYEEYIYDGDGQRVIIIRNGSLLKRYCYDYPFEAIAIKNSNGNEEYYTKGSNIDGGNGYLISTFAIESGSNYYHYNHHGDVTNTSDQNGLILNEFFYNSFGETMQFSSNSSSVVKYSSKPFDNATQLYYFGYRYYMPEIGRWISKDPIKYLSGDVNLYRYLQNNPMLYVDQHGLNKKCSRLCLCIACVVLNIFVCTANPYYDDAAGPDIEETQVFDPSKYPKRKNCPKNTCPADCKKKKKKRKQEQKNKDKTNKCIPIPEPNFPNPTLPDISPLPGIPSLPGIPPLMNPTLL